MLLPLTRLLWEQIAVQMNYSTKYVFDLHRTALKMIEVPETPY